MDVPPPVLRGGNGFLWQAAANHYMPEAKLQVAVDEDCEAFKRCWDRVTAERLPKSRRLRQYEPLQESAYSARRRMRLGGEACQLGLAGSRCLAAVLANPAATRYLIDVEPARLDNARRVLAAAHFSDAYGGLALYVGFDPMALDLTASALDAVEGRVSVAMQRTCQLLAWGRHHSARERWRVRNFVARVGSCLVCRRPGPGFRNLRLDCRLTHLHRRFGGSCLLAEHVCRACEQLLFPRRDLVGVDVESLGQLGHRVLALDRGQGHFGFEGRGVVPADALGHDLLLGWRYHRLSEQEIHLSRRSDSRGQCIGWISTVRRHAPTDSAHGIRHPAPPKPSVIGHAFAILV